MSLRFSAGLSTENRCIENHPKFRHTKSLAPETGLMLDSLIRNQHQAFLIFPWPVRFGNPILKPVLEILQVCRLSGVVQCRSVSCGAFSLFLVAALTLDFDVLLLVCNIRASCAFWL